MTSKPVTVKLRDDMVDQLETEAENLDKNRSEYIRDLLRQRHAIDNLSEELDYQIQNEEDLREEIEADLRSQFQNYYSRKISKLEEDKEDLQSTIEKLEARIDAHRDEVASIEDRVWTAVNNDLEKQYQHKIDDLEERAEYWKGCAKNSEEKFRAAKTKGEEANEVALDLERRFNEFHISFGKRIDRLEETVRTSQPLSIQIWRGFIGLFKRDS